MPDETLLTLADEVRGKTLRLLEGVPPDVARYTGPGLNNSTLWHAGHALMLVEHLCLIPATGGEPAYPKGWFEMFGWKSVPASIPREAWPALSDVIERLREQLSRLRTTIESLTPQHLDRVVDADRNRTLRYAIVHGLHDEASHQGEILLLKKLFGRQSAVSTSTGS
jgi:DinB superfamily